MWGAPPIKIIHEPLPPTLPKPESHKSPAKQERDRERLEQYQEEHAEPEDTAVHDFLAAEKHLLESTAFRDQEQGFKGEVVARVNAPGLGITEADVLRDRKRGFVHPFYVQYGFQ